MRPLVGRTVKPSSLLSSSIQAVAAWATFGDSQSNLNGCLLIHRTNRILDGISGLIHGIKRLLMEMVGHLHHYQLIPLIG